MLFQGDALEIMKSLPDHSIDLVITDPPYLKKYLYLYEGMAAELPRLLKRGGSLLAIVPHYAIPQVISDIGKYLKYRWLISMWQPSGNHPRMAMGIEVMWKPIVWWVNEAYPQGRGFKRDGFENTQPKKTYEWEQSMSWAEYCLSFAKDGETILDPFMGVGTVGVAAKNRGLPFIGIELDEERFKICKERIDGNKIL